MDRKFLPAQIGDDREAGARDARSHTMAFVASVVAHALLLGVLVWMLPEAQRPQHQWVVAYLVDLGQSGGGTGRGGGAGVARATSPLAPARDAVSAAMPPIPHHAHRHAARAQATPERAAPAQPAAIPATPGTGVAGIAARSERAVPASAGTAPSGTSVASATAFGSGSDGGGGGHGSGGIGDGSGSSFAHVEYGRNPIPTYPIEARRRAQHGTVLLRIQVASDGSVERVEVARSSGFDLLDDSAIETVRTRWRFVAAQRDGIAVESWCEVPIRFALTEAQVN